MQIEEVRAISNKVQYEFGQLNNVQLSWKSSENSWSISQVLDHMIVSNRRYFEILKKVSSGKHRESFWEKLNPFTKYTGKNMIRNLGEVVDKKYPSPMLFRPSKKMIGQDIFESFATMQNELYDIFKKLEEGGYKEKVITSPVANLITLSIGDVMELIISHEKRHLKQAISVKNAIGFPD